MQSRSLHQKRALCFVLIVLLLSAVGMTKANPVDLRTAREVGMKFMNANTNTPLRNIGDLQLVTTYSISRGDAAFYVFNMPNGFVIVAADDCSTPILGYSNKEHFNMDNIPVQMQEYLQGFVEQIQYGIDHHLSANETVSRRWELVKATGRITEQRAITTVSPLLTDSWGQGCYYNALCPEDANGPCGHTMTGCTGTAMGQIMRFWSYPSSGSGSMVYTPTGYPEQSVDFAATTYQWANMPNSLSSSSSSTQINAVATLLWHCGIALQAIYGPDGTSAQPSQVPGVLVGIFNYSSDLYGAYKSNYSDSTWLSMIKNNLDYGRPIHYSGWNSQGGNGHSFVCDGYDSNDYLHFNWGWHGSYNNSYFALDALVVSNYDFSYGNYAIFDIHPNCSSGTYYQINTTASPSNGGTVYGSGPYNCGNDCTLTAVPADGYIFCSWTENGEMVSIEPTYSFTAFENRDLVANFIAGEGCSLVFNFYDSYGDGWNGNALTVSNSEGCYSYEELTFTDGMSATISRNVVDGNHIVLGWMPGSWTSECSFTVSYENGTMICEGSNLSNGFSYEFDVDCDSPLPIYYTITTETNPSNGGTVSGDGSFIYGQTCTLVAAANSGYGFTNWTKNDTTVSTHATYSFTVTENAVYVANFSATVPSTPTLQVVAKYYPDANNPASPYVKVYWGEEMVEHFETDDFGLFDWQMDPYYPWTITTSNPYEGPYCMVSGGSGVANVVSNMTVTVNIPADGEMSFWGKISCESNWDYGYFYIDSIQKGSYTGDGNWGEKKFEITAGEHTFQWRYTKDGSVNSNDDCFYVDYITFYRRPEPLGPGWHTYCESEFNNALGSELTTSPSWAYEYPASFLHDNYAGFNITKVSLFSDDMYSAVGGNYTCCIYVGGTMPAAGTMVSTITVDVPSNQNDWVDWDLTTPVNVTGTDPIWVVWTANTTVSSWPAGL